MRTLIVLAILATAAGCRKTPGDAVLDQCLRQRLFIECLDHTPRQPAHVGDDNDHDGGQAVEACSSAAYLAARRPRVGVAAECLLEEP